MSHTLVTTPRVVRTIGDLRRELISYRQEAGQTGSVGFVPTMGFLHAGHASLMRRSVRENGLTVLSIFVNPLQFGPNEDFDRYPRDEARDLAIAADAGVDLVFLPDVSEMYPAPLQTRILIGGVTERLCGASRPGHFDGVGVVVTKLLNLVQPDRAYFGLKDAQQVAVIETMVRDLNMPVAIVPCPIVRDADGLALSSRNVYLSAEEREQALSLSRTLELVPEWIRSESLTAPALTARIREHIAAKPLADIDYVEALAYPDLTPLPDDRAVAETAVPVLVALAVRFGRTRLIDNLLLPAAKG